MDITTFIKKNVTSCHLTETLTKILSEEGFTMLSMGEPWKLQAGAYMSAPSDSLLFAWVIGEDYNAGDAMRIGVAHTDYPTFHIKPAAEIQSDYCLLDTEAYGGAILPSWFDRPLGVAGRVFYRDGERCAMRLVDSIVPVVTIPNQAIHYNRDVNKGVEVKKQLDMRPLAGTKTRPGWFRSYVSSLADCEEEDLLDYDLWLYNSDEPETVGIAQDMISSPRLDNQTSCYALSEALCEAAVKRKGLVLAAFYDNEEIGSQTKQGADSALLKMLLEKIYDGLAMAPVRLSEAVMKSRMISCDVAHAMHPNHPERFDAANSAVFGDGIVLKMSVNQRYTYEASMISEMELLCRKYAIPYKKHVNHSDMPGGSTMGPLVSSWLPMPTLDVGVPIMAMHSARELMAKQDMEAFTAFAKAFFTDWTQF